jgi:hypothetical protein
LLIVKKILWSTKIGRGWSGTLVFPDMPLAQFAKRKYGFSFDERTESTEGFLQDIGVDQ